MSDFFDKIGGRKFFASMASLLSAHVLVYQGKIGDSVYSAVMIATVAAFITLNVAQKYVEKSGQQPPVDK